jgi:hypothetical protein
MRNLLLNLLAGAGFAAASPCLALGWAGGDSPLQIGPARPPAPYAGFGRTAPSPPLPGEMRAWSGTKAFQRVRISYEHQNFYTGAPGGRLGLGQAFTFNQDVVGAKLAFLGGESHGVLPQLAVGLQYRRQEPQAALVVLGPRKRKDYYASATKLLLGKHLMLNGAVRLTKVNRPGLYGLTPTRSLRRKQYEASAAWLPTPRLALGVEYRTRADTMNFAAHRDWTNAFVAYAFSPTLSLTGNLMDLGDIGQARNQRAASLSLQAAF